MADPAVFAKLMTPPDGATDLVEIASDMRESLATSEVGSAS
jgi:hypothetical protein